VKRPLTVMLAPAIAVASLVTTIAISYLENQDTAIADDLTREAIALLLIAVAIADSVVRGRRWAQGVAVAICGWWAWGWLSLLESAEPLGGHEQLLVASGVGYLTAAVLLLLPASNRWFAHASLPLVAAVRRHPRHLLVAWAVFAASLAALHLSYWSWWETVEVEGETVLVGPSDGSFPLGLLASATGTCLAFAYASRSFARARTDASAANRQLGLAALILAFATSFSAKSVSIVGPFLIPLQLAGGAVQTFLLALRGRGDPAIPRRYVACASALCAVLCVLLVTLLSFVSCRSEP
jgi:hypothetical protein